MDKAPDAMKDFFKGAMASMKPYAKKYKPIEGADVELVPGIHALAARATPPATRSTRSRARARRWCSAAT